MQASIVVYQRQGNQLIGLDGKPGRFEGMGYAPSGADTPSVTLELIIA